MEAVGGQPGERARPAQAVVEEKRDAETAPIGDASSRRPLVAGAPPGTNRFDKSVGIREQVLRKPAGDHAFANETQDHVAFRPGKGNEAEDDAVLVENAGVLVGTLDRGIQPLGKTLRLGAHDIAGQVVVFEDPGRVCPHCLQGDRDYLL